jgi:hypothetical protein
MQVMQVCIQVRLLGSCHQKLLSKIWDYSSVVEHVLTMSPWIQSSMPKKKKFNGAKGFMSTLQIRRVYPHMQVRGQLSIDW